MSSPPLNIARECSPFLDTLIERHPGWFDHLKQSGRLETSSTPRAEALEERIAEQGLDAGLRNFRNLEMMRIVWRELNRAAALEETLLDLSVLAETCLQSAVAHHSDQLKERFGTPRNDGGQEARLAAISMGKLGGFELNLSSDIDLVFTFSEAGECDGPRGLSNEQFFTRLARRVINSLTEVSEHGFCFRVDTRLRPFGESGPLVCSFDSMEQYYQREGRDWERYALIKARPVAGDLDAGAGLLSRLAPFVYRRYTDFGAVEALHEMYLSLREDSARHDRARDIKRGPGGIREIEFLVQTFQLLRGGREPMLQTTSLLAALRSIEQLSMLPEDIVHSLKQNYHFLRRLENAIQALHDQQTHTLPEGEDLERVARVMDCREGEELLGRVDQVRKSIQALIEDSFPQQQSMTAASPARAQWRALRAEDWREGGTAHGPLETFMLALSRLKLSDRASRRLDQFMPDLLEQLEQNRFEAPVLADVLNLVLSICRRSAYLSLLVQNPSALKRMLSLFGESDWIASTVIRHPALLDELIDPALGKLLPDREEMAATARRVLDSNQDTETALQALNHMKLAFSLRTAVAELETTLSAQQVQKSLTELAETIIQSCLELALAEVKLKHGSIPGDGLAVIGYGSLGSMQLAYTSDLDLIFLYAHKEETSDGTRPLEPERYYTALVRRLLSYLTASTPSGRLYEVDTRLRPNGRSGLLVSSLGAFEKYQKNDAWTWELQALSRARPCAGSQVIGKHFLNLRKEILGQPGDSAPLNVDILRDDIRKMRLRLRDAHPNGDPYKHGKGGLIDIDFVAQLGVLETGHAHSSVIDAVSTARQLQALCETGWLAEEHYSILSENLGQLTRARHMKLLSRAGKQPFPDTEACSEVCHGYLG